MISIPETVAQLGSEDQKKAYQARQAIADLVSTAGKPNNATEQAEIASALAGELTATVASDEGRRGRREGTRPKHPAQVRNQVAVFLSQLAEEAQVPALAETLKDFETRDMARWALERIPTAAATAALIEALNQVGPEFQVGVLNALSARSGADVQGALHRAAGDPDEEVRSAAVEALANFPEKSNDDVLAAAGRTGSDRARARAQKARVRFAEGLAAAGQKDAAVAVYRAILDGETGEPQKKAARIALEQLT